MTRLSLLALGLVVAALPGAIAIWSVHRRVASPASPSALKAATELSVPQVHGSINIDGEREDQGWLESSARTEAFVDSAGAIGHPYSDAKMAWGDGFLYLLLYAADEDIHTPASNAGEARLHEGDSFHIVVDDGTNQRIFDFAADGRVADATRPSSAVQPVRPEPDWTWSSGARVAQDTDGTINRPDDEDEEWSLEIAIPLASIGLRGAVGERVSLAAHRCDTPKGGARVCASWGEREPTDLVLR